MVDFRRPSHISGNTISNIGIKEIAVALQINHTLQRFNISGNKISDDGAIALSECLKDNNTLQELNMSHNEVSNHGIINIGKALNINTTLRLLDISYNETSDCGVIVFSECLKKKNNVKKLKISLNNGICIFLDFMVQSCTMHKMSLGDTGAILISAYIYSNHNIQKVDISHNNISDKGAVAISECLQTNKALKELVMSNNKISNHGIIKIAEAIQISKTLRLIDISCNNTTRCKEVVTALSDCLKHNNGLEVLGISWNCMNTTYVYAVNKINNKSYVGNTWPQWTRNPVCNVFKYDREDLFDHLHFNCKYSNDTMSKLQFDDIEAILLTAFVHGNVDLTKFEIVNCKISDNAAMVISDFLKTNVTLQKLRIL